MFKKIKKILIALAAALVLTGGVAAYLWTQATALPDWYVEDEDDGSAPSVDERGDATPRQEGRGAEGDAPPWAWRVVEPAGATGTDGRSPVSEASGDRRARGSAGVAKREIRDFHVGRTAKNPIVQRSIRASRATFEGGRLEAGVVLNLSKVEAGDFETAADRDSFRRATRAFPVLRKRSVYLGVEDRPTFGDDGIMRLGPSPVIRIGELRLSLASAARRLGTSEAKVRRQFDAELRRLKVRDPELVAP